MIENKSDLISREALKEDFADMREGYPIFSDTEMLSTKDIAKIIDNAPTVELRMGRMVNGVIIPIERPQGEWAIDKSGVRWCKFCGAAEVSAWTDFCHNCGADMRQNKEPDRQITIEEYMQSLKGGL